MQTAEHLPHPDSELSDLGQLQVVTVDLHIAANNDTSC